MMYSTYIQYLDIMIDARLNFKHQVEHVSNKASDGKSSIASDVKYWRYKTIITDISKYVDTVL